MNRFGMGWVGGAVVALASVAVGQAAGQVAGQGAGPIRLTADLVDAPRRILHATEVMPVTAGTQMTLVYPKWIPGEHGPTGPLVNMAGFEIRAGGQPVRWERDPVDMYAFHVTVPAGATELTMAMDYLAIGDGNFTAGGSTSANLALLSWNTLVVYPQGAKASDVMVTPSVRVLEGWKFGTALDATGGANGGVTAFKTVSLETLVDSPVLAGRWFREVPLAPEVSPKHYLDMAGDGPEDVELSQKHIEEFSKLVRETGALYRSRHYGSYHFLVTLSDQVAHFGLEHHQSSDDRVPEKTFIDNDRFVAAGELLPHEFTHSWNGKYRRPAGLATPNYQEPMIGDLLWVYEGLTEYLGDVLAARSGIWTPEQYRGYLASSAAEMDNWPGREWRDLQDTARSVSILNDAGGSWDNWRRGLDYYPEGELIWLDVDTTIREKTKGKKSLDDFVAAFHGLGGDTPPKVVPYTFEDVVAGLNAVVPNDWAAFLRERLDRTGKGAPLARVGGGAPLDRVGGGAPLGGVERGGYKLLYADAPNPYEKIRDDLRETPDFWYSVGVHASKSGVISDVLKDGPSDKAGLAPGMRLVAVNGRAYTPTLLLAAVRAGKGSGPATELIVENTGYFRVVRLDYHEGARFPVLERTAGTADRLDEIIKGRTKDDARQGDR